MGRMVVRAYYGVWKWSPQQGQGTKPLVWSREWSDLKLKTFWEFIKIFSHIYCIFHLFLTIFSHFHTTETDCWYNDNIQNAAVGSATHDLLLLLVHKAETIRVSIKCILVSYVGVKLITVFLLGALGPVFPFHSYPYCAYPMGIAPVPHSVHPRGGSLAHVPPFDYIYS